MCDSEIFGKATGKISLCVRNVQNRIRNFFFAKTFCSILIVSKGRTKGGPDNGRKKHRGSNQEWKYCFRN